MNSVHRIAYRLRPSEWLATEWPSVLLGFGAIAALVLLCRRGAAVELLVHEDGTIFVSEAGAEPVYAHWRGFVQEGATFVLWGADGRYRLVIPRRALAPPDFAALLSRTGVDLLALEPGQEAELRVVRPGPKQ